MEHAPGTYRPDGLEFDERGFSFYIRGEKQFVEWVMVKEIVGYRRPLGESGLLCVGVRFSNFRQYMEVHEEMEDYPAFVNKLYEVFPRIKRNWWKPIVSWYGDNYLTIHGISLGNKTPAEHYLAKPKKKRLAGNKMRVWLSGWVILLVLAAVQSALVWLIARWDGSALDDIFAVTALPCVLVVVSCRLWGKLDVFFLHLSGFYLAELFLVLVFGIGDGTLAAKLLDCRFSYLLILGLEILLALAILLLPNRKAAGIPPGR